uniref:peptidylprolyl isomerase n=1 Tax=Candidatus Kentrum sp. FM TaxID=2126340 RepID=A0A450VP20_9GAMM|nr:MAG: FKBP-type peptidyl-prolyl cis-trans isomerase SlyD [Candidatus Kentron sp. FM]VFJ44558.1 MAG: FKBP-type peptidyl-prolyl cis-trans isomerase SlyD [Candidatus Kentron sp. FM]VFK06544.1 MAG: FKBP-type peptidyl-prolyl cis-trans isomerase SlyD [Candidatus Kentron sp. FM]
MPNQIVGSGKVVYLTYEIRDASDDDILERTDMPVGYVHGGGSNLFTKIERSLEGREVGETVYVTLSPEESFGYRDSALTFTDDIKNVPPEYRHIGAEALFESDGGEQVTMVVSRIEDGKVTLDGNHPLAGKTVTFRVTISSIRNASKREIARGALDDHRSRLH